MSGLPGKMKPWVPDEALDWLDRFDGKYQATNSCPSCGQNIELGYPSIEWEFDTPIGKGSFLAGPLPVYECSTCQKVYFPAEVFDAVVECFTKEGLRYFSDFQVHFEKPENWERLPD